MTENYIVLSSMLTLLILNCRRGEQTAGRVQIQGTEG